MHSPDTARPMTVSVVIPVYNEAQTQPQVLDATVFEQVQKVVMSTKYKALEGLALEIARRVLQVFEPVQLATVVIRRKQLFIPGDIRSADVELTVDREDLSDF